MSTTVNSTVFTQVITIKVLSIDTLLPKCDILVKMNERQVTLRGINISSLLKWKFANQSEDYTLGKVYSTTIADPYWRNMPFSLIAYGDKNSPDYLLKCVNVAKSTKIEGLDVFGNTIIDYKNNYYSKRYYRRFINSCK